MTLLKNILFVVLLGVSLTAFAQQKEAEQISGLYLKKDYEKCLKKSTKFTEAYPKEYVFPLYSAMSHWQFYKVDKQNADLLLSLGQLQAAYKVYGKKVAKFAAEQKQIHTAALKVGPTLLKDNKKEDAKALYGYLATIYKDTTEEYTWLFPMPGGTANVSVANTSLPSKKDETPMVTQNSIIDQLLAVGRSFLGLPYRSAGFDPSTGFDCSGFVSYLFRQFNVNLPRSSQELSLVGSPVTLSQVKPGDLLFYGTRKGSSYRTSHVALVYSFQKGNLAFIHSSSQGVVIDDQTSASWEYWERRFLFAKRVL
ncbi:hypothetical protein BH09BAC1_BH09BAC1_18160 [soil metagenome]